MFTDRVVNLTPISAAGVGKVFVTHESPLDSGAPYCIVRFLEIEAFPKTARLLGEPLDVHRVVHHAFAAVVFDDVLELLVRQLFHIYPRLHAFPLRLIPPPPFGRASPPPRLCGPMSASVGLRGLVEGRLAARP